MAGYPGGRYPNNPGGYPAGGSSMRMPQGGYPPGLFGYLPPG